MFNAWSFRKKLIFIWLTVQLLVTGVTALVVVESAIDSIETDIQYQSAQIQPLLNSALVTPLIQRDYASVIAILKEMVNPKSIQEIIVNDSSGNLIAKQSIPNFDSQKIKISPLIKEFALQADGINLGIVTVAISRERLAEAQSNIFKFAAMVALGSLFIFYIFALLLTRYITKPISELAQIATKISKGDFQIPQFIKRKDEIGALQDSFNSMSLEISKRIGELHNLNVDLESRVQERTEQLRLARDELIQKLEDLKLLGSVVDNSHFAISVADLKVPGIPLIYVNDAFTKVTGYPKDEVIGTKCRIFQDGITDTASMNQINFALKNHSACTVEFLDQRKNGESFWNRLSVFPVEIDHTEPRYYVIFQNDISELKKSNDERAALFQEIQENQRLKSLGVLVAGLAHEINNPLGVALTATTHVSQSAANIRKNIANLKATDLAEFLEDEELAFQLIFENLKRASDLVKGFKNVAADRSVDENKEINLLNYLQTIKQSLTPVLKNAQCNLALDIDPAIQLKINAGSFGQLITNLVLNATIHAFDGIDDRQIQILGSQNTNEIILKIRDNGNGISSSVLPNLFTPFYTTNRGKGGTGLGLYISRQIATEIFGGSLSVQNLTDRGCEFTLKIPKKHLSM